MSRNLLPLLLTFFLFVCINICKAQTNNESFSALSSTAYADQIIALKARTIPQKYDRKEEQKTYAEIVQDRNRSLIAEFEGDKIIKDTFLLNKCNRILQAIKANNPGFPFQDIRLYINRSLVANASCYGEGTLFINLGLFLWVDNDDELALVIGHELAHQFLEHGESKIKKNIALFSSDDFKKEMSAIKKSSSGKYERYKKLMADLVTNNGMHSRYKESEADSLGVLLISNARYNVEKASKILLKFDHVEDLFTKKNLYSISNTFEASGIEQHVYQKQKKYNGLSSVSVSMNADAALDSIKTHPDCVDRYKKIQQQIAIIPETKCCVALTPDFYTIKVHAMNELLRYVYEIRNYTLCAHLALFAIENGLNASQAHAYLSLCFSGIYEADKQFQKFTVSNANAPAESNMKELQDLIFNANSEQILRIASWFLQQSTDQQTEEYAFAKFMYGLQEKQTDPETVFQSFKRNNPKNKFNYLLNPKTPKK